MTDRSNRTERPWRDHPLRETALAHLEPDAGSVLIPAAVYLEAALLELATGPTAPGTHERRIATGLMLDSKHLVQESRGILDGWSGSDALRRAIVEALDCFAAAQAHLSAVLDKEAGR